MKLTIQWQSRLIAGFLLLFNIAAAHAETLPKDVFSFDAVRIGVTTIDDIQNKYGKSPIFRESKADESNKQICYVHISAKRKTFAIFEAGPMGGFNRVTGFRLVASHFDKKCTLTDIDLSNITSGNGIQLNQSRKAFMEKFKVDFKHKGGKLVYEGESKREASKEELDKLHKMWPDETQIFFDVITTIKASFKDDRLIDYYVSTIESY